MSRWSMCSGNPAIRFVSICVVPFVACMDWQPTGEIQTQDSQQQVKSGDSTHNNVMGPVDATGCDIGVTWTDVDATTWTADYRIVPAAGTVMSATWTVLEGPTTGEWPMRMVAADGRWQVSPGAHTRPGTDVRLAATVTGGAVLATAVFDYLDTVRPTTADCVPACMPSDCAARAAACGTIDDGCGGSLDCGSCASGQVCAASVCVPQPSSCVVTATWLDIDSTTWTADYRIAPGTGVVASVSFVVQEGPTQGSWPMRRVATNGRWQVSPGDRTSPGTNVKLVAILTDGTVIETAVFAYLDVGEPRTASCDDACMPATCAGRGTECGAINDGCGGTVSCGACDAGATCSAGICVADCAPSSCGDSGVSCGPLDNGCGTTLDCGSCAEGEYCSAGSCIAACRPHTCASSGATCGDVADGCGGTLACGDCGGTPPPPDDPPLPVDGDMEVGTNFWFLAPSWTGEQPFVDNVDFERAWNNGTNIWSQRFLAQLAPYTTLRFMDWGATNWSEIERWSQRRMPTDAGNGNIGTSHGAGLAYEWMIDLCNRAEKNMWVNLPHRSDTEYHRNLAQLIKDRLRPGLKVFVEYSNETWNGMFSQAGYCVDRGVALGLAGGEWEAGFKYHVYAAVRAFHEFNQVFGAERNRVVRVIAGRRGDAWLAGVHLEALDDQAINPHGVQIDAYAINAYFGNGSNGNAGNIVSILEDAMQTSLGQTAQVYEVVSARGIPLVAYEGGQHVASSADIANRRPEMYDLYITYLNQLQRYLRLFTHYAHCARYSTRGAWGAMESTDQPISQAHKYRALVDWTAAH